MKIRKDLLRRIIREEYSRLINEYGPLHGEGAADQAVGRMRGMPSTPKRKAHGWMEFIEMAEAGDYSGAGDWIQGLAADHGITLSREEEDGFIESAAFGGTPHELTYAWNEFLSMRGM